MGQDPTQADTAVTRPGGPRLSLRYRLIIWVMAATAIPVVLLTVVQSRIIRAATGNGPARDALVIGRAVATALSGRVDGGWSDQAGVALEAVVGDAGVLLVRVTDPAGRLLHHHERGEGSDRLLAEAGLDASGRELTAGQPRTVGRDGEMALCRVPIWSSLSPDAGRRIAGYVVIGVQDPAIAALARRLIVVQLTAAGGSALLVLLASALASRRVVDPLRRLLDATWALARNEQAPPVPANEHDEIGLLGQAFNEMARRLSEANGQLRQHNENLEGLIAERTVELEAANRRLAEQIADKDAFLRSVSHDLSAPLRNIDGMAATILRKHRPHLDQEVIHKLERISANVRQQSDLINELVELSRQRSKPTCSNLIDLNEMVRGIFEELGHEFGEAGISAHIEGSLPIIRAAPTRIRQVFQNLIDNAAKYMMDSPRRMILVSADEDLQYYRFSVKDTGRGIAWEDQPHIFGVFRRGIRSGTHTVGGKGVGLASVKTIVEGYGGQIWVDSELGKGATFHFTLARQSVSPPLDQSTADAA